MATVEGDDRLLATAQHIVNSLRTSQDVTDDMLLILSGYDNRLSNISDLMAGRGGIGSGGGGLGELGQLELDKELIRFDAAESVILRGDGSTDSRPWEDTPDESCEYLAAIDELLALMEDLNFQENEDAMDRAESAVQMAMAKLEDEFRSVMARNTVPLDVEQLHGSMHRVSLSFIASELEKEEGGGIINDLSQLGEEDDPDSAKRCFHERGGSVWGDVNLDLISPAVVTELRDIAERMIRAGYEKECCQAYSCFRRDVFDEFLSVLGVEKLSIEDVQKMEWRNLDEMMKKWVQALKIVVKVLLEAEKRLCEQIFDGFETVKEICFVETAKGCVLQLMNFGEAVAIGKWSSEKLFRILDMYDALSGSLPLLQGFFAESSYGGSVYSEAQGVLKGLGEAAKGTFSEFERAVKGEASKKPIQGGDIHPLARYVMNYVKLLVDYSESLNMLLQSDEDEVVVVEHLPRTSSCDSDNAKEMSPLGKRLLSLITCLELNLDEKAKLYEDGGMQCIFLMNNKLYIVQKVKDSELAKLLGDDWVRRRRGLVRKYAMNYLRASWTKVLAHLRDEGLSGSSSSSTFKLLVKERFKNFNMSFEDVYRVQTAWKVTDPLLRTELRISISEKVIPAYRAFLGRFGSQIEGGKHAGKYIKFSAEDLEGYLADLFEGVPNIIHHVRRKGT